MTADARAVLRDGASEAQFQAAVLALAKQTGWITYHVHDSRRSAAGFPDLVLVHPGHRFVWFLELKSARGKLSADQVRWQDAIRPCTRVTASWARPADWDAIADVLVHGPARAWQPDLGTPTARGEAGQAA